MKAKLFLFLYSILKAFLPLPSIEAVLVPLCLNYPTQSLLFALISGIGTALGGLVGYELAYYYGRELVLKFIDEDTLTKGESQFKKHGIWYVVIGSISPFPDFVLAYIAGIVKMNRVLFLVIDGLCRFIRSLLIVYSLNSLNTVLPIEQYATGLSILILFYFVAKYFLKKSR